jgi:hypothetical protein
MYKEIQEKNNSRVGQNSVISVTLHVKIHIVVFWTMRSCSVIGGNQRFEKT